MKKTFLIITFLSSNLLFSQNVNKTLLEGTHWGFPFELKQVTLSKPDSCGQLTHSQIIWYFKNENDPKKADVGMLVFNQYNDWVEFTNDILKILGAKKSPYGAYPIATGKTYFISKSDGKPFDLSIVSNSDNKLALLDKRYNPPREIVNAQYGKKIHLLWQNDKCEGGLLID
ncbi:MAG: hypothetical protein H8E55_72120 [Pelagibacterales bacterium]|nr:hypothetical protein [Pelagibacterales bacterium]